MGSLCQVDEAGLVVKPPTVVDEFVGVAGQLLCLYVFFSVGGSRTIRANLDQWGKQTWVL